MDLFRWLQNLGKACRDEIPDVVLASWVCIMDSWRPLTDEQWAAVANQVVQGHGAGPLRFPEIREAVRDVLEEVERRRNMEGIAKLRKDLQAE
jgi:hypothetical protein